MKRETAKLWLFARARANGKPPIWYLVLVRARCRKDGAVSSILFSSALVAGPGARATRATSRVQQKKRNLVCHHLDIQQQRWLALIYPQRYHLQRLCCGRGKQNTTLMMDFLSSYRYFFARDNMFIRPVAYELQTAFGRNLIY